jgi:Skp family chaperone for outer membrane proteins
MHPKSKTLLLLPLVASALLVGPVGCEQASREADSPEAMAEEMLDCLNDTADLLEGIRDKASAEAAAPQVKNLNERWARLRKRFDEPQELSEEKKQELSAEYPPRTQAAFDRLIQAYAKAVTVPGAEKVLSELQVGDFGHTR